MKPGGPIPDKGKKIIVRVKNIRDLSRDVIKVCSWLVVYAVRSEWPFSTFP